jgi:hypothetical protein
MSLAARLREDYLAKRQKVRVLDVEAWVTPITIADQRKAQAMHPDDLARQRMELLVMKALDADGNRLFSRDDIDVLMAETDAAVLQDVWAAMNGSTVSAQAEK